MNSIARFNARVARTWNAQVWPEMAHLEQQNAYLFPKPARQPKVKPAVTTYKTTLTTLARKTPEQVEAERQIAIRQTRLANLETARAVKAEMQAQRARTGSKSTRADHTTAKETVAEMNQIDALRAQVAALTAQIERLASPAAPAPVAPAPVASKPASKPAKAPYVKTALKMVDYGKGRRALQIDTTLVVVAWNGQTWDYACGTRKGTAADRGEAFAKVNVLLANAGLPPVRA